MEIIDDIRHLLQESMLISDSTSQALICFELAAWLGDTTWLATFAESMDEDGRIRTMARLLRAMVGYLPGARLVPFLKAAADLVAEWWLVEALTDVAVETDKIHELEKLLLTADEVPTPDLQSRLSSRIIIRMALLGHVEKAISGAHHIALEAERFRGLSDTAVALARAGRFEEAILVSREVLDRDERGRAQAHILLFRARLGGILVVAKDIKDIESEHWRSWAAALLTADADPVASPQPSIKTFSRKAAPSPPPWLHQIRHRAAEQPAWHWLFEMLGHAGSKELSVADLCTKPLPPQNLPFLDQLRDRLRPGLLDDLRLLIPVVISSGSRRDLERLQENVRTVVSWWP